MSPFISNSVPGPIVDASTSAFLKALASETRQRVMLLFADVPRLSVGEVAERANLSASTASAHLAELRRGGLLHAARAGKTVHYSVNADQIAHHLGELQTYLAGCCPPSQ